MDCFLARVDEQYHSSCGFVVQRNRRCKTHLTCEHHGTKATSVDAPLKSVEMPRSGRLLDVL